MIPLRPAGKSLAVVRGGLCQKKKCTEVVWGRTEAGWVRRESQERRGGTYGKRKGWEKRGEVVRTKVNCVSRESLCFG